MLGIFKKLRQKGIMSINQRNADFVLKYNDRKHYPLVDDKLKTKKLAIEAGISVPQLYATIESEQQIKHFDELVQGRTDFVVKPACGSGGDGILVVCGQVLGRYRLINGKLMTKADFAYHLSCLLSGAFSLGGHPDYAIIEQRVVVDPVFAAVSHEGIPDIRIITLLGYPAMAMLRLPTRQSGGKANLHQGAIGAGIDMATGRTVGGVLGNEPIDYHIDTMNSIIGIEVPYWQKMLEIAAGCYEMTGLGYLGVDLVLDKEHGPMMLELNARPGLNIQIANAEGGVHRYRQIEAEAARHIEPVSVLDRVLFSRTHFKRLVD